ncbi:hypothetical protein [Lentzea xinjiangensis]|uniref:hypothetical protein n=1 Tax=Lentzea xinjiangensis TaxID=402600 RepID=UPI0011607C65|nr:hypothetical protein [Lentzea xinjiangensis]
MADDQIPREAVDGFPWCDTCKQPAVWSEFNGWRHSTAEYRFGLPQHLDNSGHEVTAKEWTNTPQWGNA